MRKMNLRLVLALGCLFLVGCAPGVQPLLDDYNAMFEVTLAGMEGLNLDWLPEHHRVPTTETTLNMSAPKHCDRYEWKLEANPGSNLPADFDIKTCGGTSQNLVINLQAKTFQPGYYTLTCEVDYRGQTFRDKCEVNIVDASKAGGKP